MFDDKHSNDLVVVEKGSTITHGGFMDRIRSSLGNSVTRSNDYAIKRKRAKRSTKKNTMGYKRAYTSRPNKPTTLVSCTHYTITIA